MHCHLLVYHAYTVRTIQMTMTTSLHHFTTYLSSHHLITTMTSPDNNDNFPSPLHNNGRQWTTITTIPLDSSFPFSVSLHNVFPYQCNKQVISPQNRFTRQSRDNMSHSNTPPVAATRPCSSATVLRQ